MANSNLIDLATRLYGLRESETYLDASIVQQKYTSFIVRADAEAFVYCILAPLVVAGSADCCYIPTLQLIPTYPYIRSFRIRMAPQAPRNVSKSHVTKSICKIATHLSCLPLVERLVHFGHLADASGHCDELFCEASSSRVDFSFPDHFIHHRTW